MFLCVFRSNLPLKFGEAMQVLRSHNAADAQMASLLQLPKLYSFVAKYLIQVLCGFYSGLKKPCHDYSKEDMD